MPMDLHAMSASSYFSEGLCYPYERQVGFWKTESMPQNNEGMQHLKFDKHLIGGERIARLLDHESRTISNSYTDPVSYQMDENKANIAAPCYKNDVFSSPLSELLSQKMRLSSNDSLYGHSVCDASNYDEEEPYESLEEIEAQTIGDLLPSDDDLLSGVTDGLDYIAQPSGGDEVEDLELFSSVGGLDLGEEQFNSDISSGQFWGTNYSIPEEQPSRTLIVRNIDSNIEDIELQALFDQYGDICTLYTACKHQGFAMISYYDLRAALNAKKALQNKSLRNRKLDIHFSVPAEDKLLEKDIYEGTLAVTKLEPRYPDGNTRFRHSYPKFKHDEFSSCLQQGPASHGLTTSFGMDNSNIYGVYSLNKAPVGRYHGNAFHHGMSSVQSNLSSIIGADVDGQQATITDSSHLLQKKNMEILNPLIFHQHSLQDYHDDLVSRHTGDGSSASLLPHHYMWNNSLKPHGMMWSNSLSFVNGVYSPQHSQRSHATHSHKVGFGPSVDPALWDRRHVYSGESPDTSSFQPGSLGNVRNSSYSLHPFEFVSPHIFPRVGGNCFGLPVASKGLQSPQQSSAILPSSGQFYPMANPFDSPYERKKGRQNESVSSQVDNKKQYELDINRIIRGEDKRTTLMIKNIPNKYTSKMLLAAIDEHHRGTYDFIYLPIDFKNKCNVGYAFINMTDPSYIIPFYQAFNGKKWEKFNSEKVASLAYARIQGKAALIAHFQNSSLMNEDKRCRPILFNTEGPNAGDQVPFPMGGNVRSRSTQNRAGTSDQSHSDSSVDTVNGEDYSSGDSSSRSSTEAE